jgi:hypothetical protein
MRASMKVSAIAAGTIAMLGTSAATATAGGWAGGQRTVNICGNTAQSAGAARGYLHDVEQESEGIVYCQSGTGNRVTHYAPQFTLIDLSRLTLTPPETPTP